MWLPYVQVTLGSHTYPSLYIKLKCKSKINALKIHNFELLEQQIVES
jgi:hypothetical protein